MYWNYTIVVNNWVTFQTKVDSEREILGKTAVRVRSLTIKKVSLKSKNNKISKNLASYKIKHILKNRL